MKKPAIMFDFHGVYFDDGVHKTAKKFSKKLKIPEQKIVTALVLSQQWNEAATGKLTAKEYWNSVAKELSMPKKLKEEIRKTFHANCMPNREVAQIVRKLRKKYEVVALSGNIKERVRYLEKKYKISKEFDQQHYSFHYGFDKPCVRLFKRAIKKMKLKPKDCVVVDDDKIFLDKVKKTGARTILFKNAKQTEKNLRRLGVKI